LSLLRVAILIVGPAPFLMMALHAARWGVPRSDQVIASNQVFAAESIAAEPVVAAPVASTSGPCSKADCEAVAATLGKRLDDSLRLIVRPPFVIAGDLSELELDSWHTDTIQPAARAMAARYFDTPPSAPITVLLFSDEASYNLYARRLFADVGISVYGYYRPVERTLVMNIGTGGGTLVHELTHALMAFDFPDVPEWFNEGLASLHEQCRFRQSPRGPWIEGLPNWRLTALREAVQAGRLASFEQLATTDEFRGPNEALHYAQARYLCLYLQERGQLEQYYRQLRADCAQDPRGVATLAKLFPGQTWSEIDAEFRAWVRGVQPEVASAAGNAD